MRLNNRVISSLAMVGAALLSFPAFADDWDDAPPPNDSWNDAEAYPQAADDYDNQGAANVDQAPSADFDQSLSPYGEWVDLPEYGRVWRPYESNVGADFRPYATGGHWVYTDYGWSFESDYPWGWAPFHYGRWMVRPGSCLGSGLGRLALWRRGRGLGPPRACGVQHLRRLVPAELVLRSVGELRLRQSLRAPDAPAPMVVWLWPDHRNQPPRLLPRGAVQRGSVSLPHLVGGGAVHPGRLAPAASTRERRAGSDLVLPGARRTVREHPGGASARPFRVEQRAAPSRRGRARRPRPSPRARAAEPRLPAALGSRGKLQSLGTFVAGAPDATA